MADGSMGNPKDRSLAILLTSLVIPTLGYLVIVQKPIFYVHVLAFWVIFWPASRFKTITNFILYVSGSSLVLLLIGSHINNYLTIADRSATHLSFGFFVLYPLIFNLILGSFIIGLPFIADMKSKD